MIFDGKGQSLFVSFRNTNDVYLLGVDGGAEVKPLTSFPTYEYPEDIALSTDSSCLYVVSSAYGKVHTIKITKKP